jgi:hypothetical protein
LDSAFVEVHRSRALHLKSDTNGSPAGSLSSLEKDLRLEDQLMQRRGGL